MAAGTDPGVPGWEATAVGKPSEKHGGKPLSPKTGRSKVQPCGLSAYLNLRD